MKTSPLTCTPSEIRALLDGTQTQIRRPVPLDFCHFVGGAGQEDDPSCWGFDDQYGDYHTLQNDDPQYQLTGPLGAPGDLLLVELETEGRVMPMLDLNGRLTLRVKAVRVEQRQEMTGVDAIACGVRPLPLQEGARGCWWSGDIAAGPPMHARNAVAAYRLTWNARYAKKGLSWESNPHCWVADVERAEAPE